MEIYTSNYARQGLHPNAIAISRRPPQWFGGKSVLDLAPTWDMVKSIKEGRMTEEEYTRQYIRLLDEREFDPQKFVLNLPEPTFLLCYESPGDFCHRRVLAEWIYNRIGVWIPEWKNEKEQAAENQKMMVDSMLDF